MPNSGAPPRVTTLGSETRLSTIRRLSVGWVALFAFALPPKAVMPTYPNRTNEVPVRDREITNYGSSPNRVGKKSCLKAPKPLDFKGFLASPQYRNLGGFWEACLRCPTASRK